MTTATDTGAAPALGAPYVKLLAVAALMGLPVAVLGTTFTSLTDRLQEAIWDDLPEAVGWSEPAWWYVLLVPVVAALIVAPAVRFLPGNGGHSPVDGVSMAPITVRDLPGVLIAACATLAGGLVLGPEAPLVALGLALGLFTARMLRLEGQAATVLGIAGAFAAIAVVIGGPLPSSLLLLEVVALSGAVASAALVPSLVPGFVAAGTGALAYTGIDSWPGMSHASFTAPDLAAYPTVRVADIGWCLVVATAIAVGVAVARPAGSVVAGVAARHRLLVLLGTALVVGALALFFRAVTDRPVDFVLFSGQDQLPAMVAETSAGVLLLAVVCKAVAYALCLGGGFRGGPIFPSVALGAAAGAMFALALPGLDSTPAVVAGIAAGAAAGMRVPIFGAVLAALLVGGDIAQTMPLAVLASVVGWLTAMAVDRALVGRSAVPVAG